MSDFPEIELPDLKRIRRDVPDTAAEAGARRMSADWLGGERQPLASLRVEIPKYVDRALAKAAADREVTKQFLVLEALQAKGYPVEDVDLIEDKRKAKRR
jgi:hypothetical protein